MVNAGEDVVGKRNPCTLLIKMKINTAIIKINMGVPPIEQK
jgi:hypothetical protein